MSSNVLFEYTANRGNTPEKTKEVKMATFTNQASLRYSGQTIVSNVVTGEITEPLEITKSALTPSYSADGVVTYAVTMNNTGLTPVTGITLIDDLGAYTFGEQTLTPLDHTPGAIMMITNGAVQPAPTVTSESPLTLTGITIPAGGNTVIIYETTTNEYASPDDGATITNTVTASSADLAESVTASETVTAESAAVLNVVKSLSPARISNDQQLTFSFVIDNTGNADAPSDTILSDTFDPALTDITVTFNGTTWTQGIEYNYDETTGIFTTTPGSITVSAATFTQDAQSGEFIIDPGEAVLSVTGTL